MKVRAAIDRLDAGPDRLVVVDYKTGREIKKKRVLEADKLQLQLLRTPGHRRYGHQTGRNALRMVESAHQGLVAGFFQRI